MFLYIVLMIFGAALGGLIGGPLMVLIGGIGGFFLARKFMGKPPDDSPDSTPDVTSSDAPARTPAGTLAAHIATHDESPDLQTLAAEVRRLRDEVARLTHRLNRIDPLDETTSAHEPAPADENSTLITPAWMLAEGASAPPLVPAHPLHRAATVTENPFVISATATTESTAENTSKVEEAPAIPAAEAAIPEIAHAVAPDDGSPFASPQAETAWSAARTPDEPPVDATPHSAPHFDIFDAAKRWLFGGNTLVRVGVVVLFFGLAFLVKFAAEHAVIPVEARYIGISIGALVALVLGWRLRLRRPGYAMAMQGLAVAALYLATFAAFRLHGLLPGSITFALLTAIGVFSAALAVLQDARSLAVIGICGGFLSPILASTGGGSHVALFSYYALLNAGILGIAWFKAWRPLNVLGFFFTFGVASAWGNRSYRDELFGTTEPFLIGFFLLYLAISLLYANRRQAEAASPAIRVAGERVDYVDGTLVFGNPLAAFGLQTLMVKDMAFGSAFSALGMGLIYLPVATLLYRRRREDFRLMVESFLALGVIFASLAIPLGLDAKWTSAAWAVEGAGIYWIGLRQQRPVARIFALLLQAGSAASLLMSLAPGNAENWLGLVPVFAGSLLSPVLVGAALLFTARLMGRQQGLLRTWEADATPMISLAGLVFANLAFPMVLDQGWSGLAWAITGAALVGFTARRDTALVTIFGGLLQLIGGLSFAAAVSHETATPLLNRFWLTCLAVALAGLFSGWRVHRAAGNLAPAATLGLAWALAWWVAPGLLEITQHVDGPFELAAAVGFLSVTALLACRGGRLAQWPAAEGASLLLLPALILLVGFAVLDQPHPAAHGGWLAWPLGLLVLWRSLRRAEDRGITSLLSVGHALSLWLTLALLTWQCGWTLTELADVRSDWFLLGWLVAPIATLALLSGTWAQSRWPVADFATAYRRASLPIAAGLWIAILLANTYSRGSALPLPYLPIVNPLDLAIVGALLALFFWQRRWHAEIASLMQIALAATTFYWLNGMLLRTLHHWADVPFDLDAMLHSTLVQSSLSLFWTSLALGLMLFATRRALRPLWLIGGALLAVVVVKLFIIDLSSAGTVERIVSFIGVGILLLVIGYFSPVPPKPSAKSGESA